MRVTHVGGAGLTLARYLEATRPGSPQIVLEPDVALTAAVRRELPLPRRHRIRVRAVDGSTGIQALATSSADAIVLDAFDAGRVPGSLTGSRFLGDCARVLGGTGVLLANLADEPGLRFVRRVVATLPATLTERALLATTEVLKGRRYGNVVLAASASPLDLVALRRAVARCDFPTRLLSRAEVAEFARTATPFDAEGEPSPVPPALGAWRVR